MKPIWTPLVLGVITGAALASDVFQRSSAISLTPHAYLGEVRSEPSLQLNTLARFQQKTSRYGLAIHAEAETQGRRDYSLDIDRAYYHIIAQDRSTFTLGRLHPWDFTTDSPDAYGLLAQREAQNPGLLLGYGYGENLEPSPILLGWVGLHYWNRSERFSFGFSLSPFFLPPAGPEVVLNPQGPPTTGRFGRLPPEEVDKEGVSSPLRIEVDKEGLIQRVVLQPQAMAHSVWNVQPGWRIHSGLSYHPAPEGTFDSTEKLHVDGEKAVVRAKVKPKFEERFDLFVDQSWDLTHGWKIFKALYLSSDPSFGAEAGFRHAYASASILHDWRPNPAADRYTNFLARTRVQFPFGDFRVFTGVFTHFSTYDLWWQGGLGWRLNPETDFILGYDIFSGGDNSYFGPWRTNDRVYATLRWSFGS